MMQKLLGICLCMLLPTWAVAQNRVSGKIRDAATQEAMGYVNVALYPEGSSSPLRSAFSDEEGRFTLDAPDGSYLFTASFVGYQSLSKNIQLHGAPLRIGLISLAEDTKQIQEIEVQGQKSGMSFDIDKKVFNVEQNLLAEGGSAAELLQNIPSVDVDAEGNVSLRGSNSVEIWINGKPSGLSGTDQGSLLEMLPAETIQKVEVITNPSSKHSPEGSSGIINVVLKESEKAGYFGQVQIGANYQEGSKFPGGNVGGNFTYSNKLVDFTLNLSVRDRQAERASASRRSTFNANDTTYLHQENRNDMNHLNGFLRTGLTFHLTSQDDFGISLMGMLGGSKDEQNRHYIYLNNQRDTTQTHQRTTQGTATRGFYRGGLDYKHSFVKDRHEISASTYYDGRQNHGINLYNDLYYNELRQPIEDKHTYQKQTVDDAGNNVYAQVDYLNKTGKFEKWEAGFKGSYNWNTSYDRSFDSLFAEHKMVENELKYNPFRYREQIYALYLSYGNRWDWFSLQIGLRGEETLTWAESREDLTKRDYFQLFPSAYFSFALPKDNEIQVNYTRRINRPRGRLINSFIDRSDPTDLRQGNPMLLPEYGNAVELNYLKTWERHTLSVGFFYRYTENVIQQVRKILPGTEDVMYTTFENLTYDQRAGAEIIAKNRLFNNYLDLTSSVTGYYYYLGENKEYDVPSTQNFSCQVRVTANVRICSWLSGQVNGNYESPRVYAQGSSAQRYSLDAGLKASLLNKSLTLSFNVRDILNSRQHSQQNSYGENFYQENNTLSCGRNYRLTISYNFGNLRKKKGEPKGKDRTESSISSEMDEDF